jgi:hypothetical protein
LALHSFENIRYARAVTGYTSPHDSTLTAPSLKSRIPGRPLSDYQAIWQSNLFHPSSGSIDAEPETVTTDNITTADKDLGLMLVGTIVS